MTHHIRTKTGKRRRAVGLTDQQLIEVWAAAKSNLEDGGGYVDTLADDGWSFPGAAIRFRVLQRAFMKLDLERQRRGV